MIALRASRKDVAILNRIDRQVAELAELLPVSSKIAHNVGLLRLGTAGIRSGLADLEARERRVQENAAARQALLDEHEREKAERARLRTLPKWEPHQIKAAEKMGFADPADWRRYIDEREASEDPSSFPSPADWRAAQ